METFSVQFFYDITQENLNNLRTGQKNCGKLLCTKAFWRRWKSRNTI